MPSPETLIAQPVKGNQEEKQKILKKCHEIIKKVKEVLSDKQEMKKMLDKVSKENERPGEEYKSRRLERIKMLLKKSDVSLEDYMTALKTTKSGYSVVLGRDIDETMINNFRCLSEIQTDGRGRSCLQANSKYAIIQLQHFLSMGIN